MLSMKLSIVEMELISIFSLLFFNVFHKILRNFVAILLPTADNSIECKVWIRIHVGMKSIISCNLIQSKCFCSDTNRVDWIIIIALHLAIKLIERKFLWPNFFICFFFRFISSFFFLPFFHSIYNRFFWFQFNGRKLNPFKSQIIHRNVTEVRAYKNQFVQFNSPESLECP